MSIHPDTRSALENNQEKFSPGLQNSIAHLMNLVSQFSAISDVNYLLHRTNSTIEIRLPKGEASWLPTRNLVRLIAKIASLPIDGVIEDIYIESMSCGCDYFEGVVSFSTNGKEYRGAYKWQWSAFADQVRSYDKFTIFPKLVDNIALEKM